MNAPTRALFSTYNQGQRENSKEGEGISRPDLKAQVRMLVHLGEEVGVRTLLEEPALTFQLGHHGLVRLVEQAQPVQAHDAPDRAGTEGREGDHEVADHSGSGTRAARVLYCKVYLL